MTTNGRATIDDAERQATRVVHDEPGKREWLRLLREAPLNYRELRRTPYGTRPLLILCGTGLFFDLNAAVSGVALQEILRDVNMDFTTFLRYSQFVGFMLLFVGIGVAHYADRHRRLPLVAGGIFVGAFLTALTSRAGSGLAYGAFDISGAIFLAMAGIPVISLLADYYPPEVRGKVFALYGLFGALPNVLIPFLVGNAVDAFGWRPMYLITAVPIGLIGLAILIRLREPIRGYMERKALGADDDVARRAELPVSLTEAWRTIFGIRTLRRLFVANAIGAPGTRIFRLVSLALYFEFYELDPSEIGMYSALSALIVLPALFLSGGIVDDLVKRRPSQVMTYYGVISLLGTLPILAFALKPPILLLVFIVGFFNFFDALVGPAIDVLYVQVTPAHVRTLSPAVRRMALATAPLGAFFVGPIMDAWGLTGGYLFCFPFALVQALVLLSAAPLFELDMRSAMAANLASEEYRRAKLEGRGKLLVCRNVDVAYSGVQVLFDVDFDVEEGEIIALLGTNGAGKSTLLKAIAGIQPASGGAIVYDGREITYMPPHECAERGIVFMPGGRGVFPGLSVRENLLLGTWLLSEEGDEAVRTRLAEVFSIFPVLAQRADTPAGALSGGEQQQLSLAQAFLCRPRLLMIDELSLGLSPAVVGELIDVVKRIHATGVTIIVVEQSVNVALTLAEKAIFMEKGEVRFFGATEELLARPDILRAVYVKGTGGGVTAAPTRQRRQELEAARPLLEVEGVTKRFGGITALDEVSLGVREGEVLGLIGPNGSGKTTLFDLISGYQLPDAGRIRFEGVDITSELPDRRAQRHLIRRFQDARLFPSLTVFETLLVALDQRLDVKNPLASALSLPQARRAERRARTRAEALIELLDLGSYRDKFVKELSTGLRRIVDLACVLANEPRLLLLDEPSSGIAQAEAEGLAPLLRRVRFETGCSILIIEHDMPLISAVADELLALDRGRVLLRGSAAEVLDDERVVESYLGGKEEAVRRSGSLV